MTTIVIRCIFALAVLLWTCAQSSAKAGGFHTEDRYNPQHIDNLPPGVRNAIYHRCRTPKALHPFASYFDNSKRIVLHFEQLLCDGAEAFCTQSGCLHQVYVSTGGHYRLVRSYYAPAGD
jgi:hypothetical protein